MLVSIQKDLPTFLPFFKSSIACFGTLGGCSKLCKHCLYFLVSLTFYFLNRSQYSTQLFVYTKQSASLPQGPSRRSYKTGCLSDFPSCRKYFICTLCIGECPSIAPFLENNGPRPLAGPRSIIFKEWNDTRTFAYVKSTQQLQPLPRYM